MNTTDNLKLIANMKKTWSPLPCQAYAHLPKLAPKLVWDSSSRVFASTTFPRTCQIDAASGWQRVPSTPAQKTEQRTESMKLDAGPTVMQPLLCCAAEEHVSSLGQNLASGKMTVVDVPQGMTLLVGHPVKTKACSCSLVVAYVIASENVLGLPSVHASIHPRMVT
eukprot:1154317-Pelagomonas_calceolata.AAC.7